MAGALLIADLPSSDEEDESYDPDGEDVAVAQMHAAAEEEQLLQRGRRSGPAPIAFRTTRRHGGDEGRRRHARGIRAYLAGTFLPSGEVTADYMTFQLFDTVQGLCSYVRSMLTSMALMKGVGVGEETATALSAVTTFLMRDLSGHLTSILFVGGFGRSFDAHAKQWRMLADVMCDVGLAVDLAAPHFPELFLPMLCLGRIAGAITGVAAGASRSALTHHFSSRDRCNTADVAAKEGAQETAATLVGMVVGTIVLRVRESALRTRGHAGSGPPIHPPSMHPC